MRGYDIELGSSGMVESVLTQCVALFHCVHVCVCGGVHVYACTLTVCVGMESRGRFPVSLCFSSSSLF